MENKWTLNGTTFISNGASITQFLIFNCSLLSLILVVGLLGNLLVCWVVFRNKTLQTANNALLVNLAANDLLKCSFDTPFFLGSLLLGEKRVEISSVLCSFQQFTYSLCSCAQLLTLVVISVERFQAIAFPFKTEGAKNRVRVWIPLIWVCGLFVAILSLTLSRESHSYMTCRNILTTSVSDSPSDPFGAFVLVPIWCFSLILITIHYLRIFVVVRQHTNKICDRGIQFKSSVSAQVSSWQSTSVSAQRTSALHLPKSGVGESGTDQDLSTNTATAEYSSCIDKCSLTTPHTTPKIVGAVCILTPTAKEIGKKRLEGKVAKRFGYIIFAVILFWVPLIVTLMLNLFMDCSQPTSRLLHELETSAMVVSSIPAAVDPVIYTLLNRQFRCQLQKLLSTARTCLKSQ